MFDHDRWNHRDDRNWDRNRDRHGRNW
jgi:hypothetical protein